MCRLLHYYPQWSIGSASKFLRACQLPISFVAYIILTGGVAMLQSNTLILQESCQLSVKTKLPQIILYRRQNCWFWWKIKKNIQIYQLFCPYCRKSNIQHPTSRVVGTLKQASDSDCVRSAACRSSLPSLLTLGGRQTFNNNKRTTPSILVSVENNQNNGRLVGNIIGEWGYLGLMGNLGQCPIFWLCRSGDYTL